MTYRERLNKFEATGLYLWKVVAACEVNNCMSIENENDFENVCAFVYDWIMDTDMSANELCCLIDNLLTSGDLKLSDFDNNWEKCRDVINGMI